MQHISRTTSDETIIKSAYSLKDRVQISFKGAGRTKQSFKDECDINNIVQRFLKTGVMEFTQKNQPRYGDVTGFDYSEAMQLVAAAKSMFNGMPAQLRDRFENEPAKFLDFVQDDRNHAECVEMGLLAPKPVAETTATLPHGEHLPKRSDDGRYREHTRKELRAEAAETKAAEADRAASEQKTNSST